MRRRLNAVKLAVIMTFQHRYSKNCHVQQTLQRCTTIIIIRISMSSSSNASDLGRALKSQFYLSNVFTKDALNG